MSKTDHNTDVLQPESLPLTITADGKCLSAPSQLRQLAQGQYLETLEIIIDGNLMIGGKSTSTLLGQSLDFLNTSQHFYLEHFEPKPDGTCLARYARKQAAKA